MSWQTQYPFESKHHALPARQRLHYVDQGSGAAVLFSHGNPTWSFYYRKLIADLSADHRAIAVDHLGCGLSHKPQDYDYCLESHTRNLLSLIEALDLRSVTIVGHDWGGAIGLNAVRLAPERFSRIVMFNTGAFPPPRIPWRIAVCRTPLLGPLAVRGGNAFARAAQKMAIALPSMSKSELAGMIAPYNSWTNRIAIQRFVDDIPFTSKHRTWAELDALERALPEMSALPIKLIWGMKDWCFDSACLERLLVAWPDADVDRIADAGHWVVEDAADHVVASVRQFLTTTKSTQALGDSIAAT